MPAKITTCVKEFYHIQALSALAKPEPFRHSHERWKRDFQQYKQQYIQNFAQAIFDYTVLVCFGEMRYGGDKCRYYNPYVPQCRYRDEAYEKATQYDPESILKAAVTLFNCDEWDSGYGGRKWAIIAQTALHRLKKRFGMDIDEVYIDRCVDLSHNSSVYFDKSQANIFELDSGSVYLDFLNYKRTADPYSLIVREGVAGDVLLKLITRAMNLKIAPPLQINRIYHENEHVNFILKYEPILWGEEMLPNEIDGIEDYEEEDYWGEEEEGDEGDYEEEEENEEDYEEEDYWDEEEGGDEEDCEEEDYWDDEER